MKRIDIHYGGQLYSVGGRSLEDLSREVADGVAAGMHWLVVNDGEGHRRPAHLLLTPGTAIALIPIPDESDETDVEMGLPDEQHPVLATGSADQRMGLPPVTAIRAPEM